LQFIIRLLYADHTYDMNILFIYLFIQSINQQAMAKKYKQRTYWPNGQHRVNKPLMYVRPKKEAYIKP